MIECIPQRFGLSLCACVMSLAYLHYHCHYYFDTLNHVPTERSDHKKVRSFILFTIYTCLYHLQIKIKIFS